MLPSFSSICHNSHTRSNDSTGTFTDNIVQYAFTNESDTSPNVQVFRYFSPIQNVAAAGTQHKIVYFMGALGAGGHTNAIYQFIPNNGSPLAAPTLTPYTACPALTAYSAAASASAGDWVVFSGGQYALVD